MCMGRGSALVPGDAFGCSTSRENLRSRPPLRSNAFRLFPTQQPKPGTVNNSRLIIQIHKLSVKILLTGYPTLSQWRPGPPLPPSLPCQNCPPRPRPLPESRQPPPRHRKPCLFHLRRPSISSHRCTDFSFGCFLPQTMPRAQELLEMPRAREVLQAPSLNNSNSRQQREAETANILQ